MMQMLRTELKKALCNRIPKGAVALPDQLPEGRQIRDLQQPGRKKHKALRHRPEQFLVCQYPKGATGSAIMFSLIQTAIENDLDPYRYLTWLLKTANNADLEDEQTVQALLPWKAPSECKAK